MGFPLRFNLCIYHHCNNNINIMSCMDDQQPSFKHYCRVCKKGFMCGRALGGHMRAHGVGDVNWKHEDDDEDEDDHVMSDWEEKFRSGSEIRVDNKRMYQLRTNPNRLKSCRTCENCGKEFLSWKSFLDHGKCSSGDGDASESLVSSPESEGEDDVGRCSNNGWSKRKRTLRSKVGCRMDSTPYVPTEEDDLFLARCLVQLANSTVVIAEAEESSASASREEERRNNAPPYHAKPMTSRATFEDKAKGVSSNPKGLFECKACKKVFNSHQALGGHRASHKKVKGCFAAKQDQIDEQNNTLGGHHQDNHVVITSDQFEQGQAHVGTSRKKSKVHECTICHRVFASGQALGGHKRCHWITSNAPPSPSLKFHFQDNLDHNNIQTPSDKLLDLNVPAWAAHGLSGVQKDPQNLLSFKVSTDHQMNLRPWIGHETRNNTRYLHQHLPSKHSINQGNNSKNNNAYIDDEADSKMKLAKLSDLHDLKDKMGDSGNSSPWLQVGIGTTTESATITTATITTATTTASMDADA